MSNQDDITYLLSEYYAGIQRVFKREPYRHYDRHSNKLEIILKRFLEINASNRTAGQIRYYLDTVATITNIPFSTLRDWFEKLKINPEWKPWGSDRGVSRQTFTPDEERTLKDYIIETYLDKGVFFSDSDFQELAVNFYLKIHKGDEFVEEFKASHGFIYKFKKRNKFSSRKLHFKRRNDVSEDSKANWNQKISALLANVPKSSIINCDETNWLTFPHNMLTWAISGSQNISCKINGNEKENFSVIASISADGDKLPLFLIAKGESKRCYKQLGDISGHECYHSSSGWSNSHVFVKYLKILRKVMVGQIHLLLDLYPGHNTSEIKEYAENNRISLYYIPPGMTDEYQPLDVKIFGVLKGIARRLFRNRYSKDPNYKFQKKDACKDLINAWNSVSNETIEESWEIYE